MGTIFYTICFSLLLYVEAEYKSYTNYKVYQVIGDSDTFEKFGKELVDFDDEVIKQNNEFLISPETVPKFLELALKYKLKQKLVNNDFSRNIASEKKSNERSKKKGFSWTAYHNVDEIYKYLENVSQTYPQSVRTVVGGQSYEGRQILGVRILTNDDYGVEYNDYAGFRSSKPAVFIESGIHAREWITPATITYFINQLMTSTNANITALRDKYDWHIFPTVNPDGYHYSHTKDRMWRKTRSKSKNGCYGADPNRNWDHNWGKVGASKDPCNYQLYGGSKAFSEVETRTLSEYISNVKGMFAYLGFHADAQCLLLPYSDSKTHSDNYDDLVKMGKTSLKYARKVNGAKFQGPGTAAEILYPVAGGSMDWVREVHGTPLVYTYELRGRFFQWPAALIYQQGNEVTQMILGLFSEAELLGYV